MTETPAGPYSPGRTAVNTVIGPAATIHPPCPSRWCTSHWTSDDTAKHHTGDTDVKVHAAEHTNTGTSVVTVGLSRFDPDGEVGPVGVFLAVNGADVLSFAISMNSARDLASALLAATAQADR